MAIYWIMTVTVTVTLTMIMTMTMTVTMTDYDSDCDSEGDILTLRPLFYGHNIDAEIKSWYLKK